MKADHLPAGNARRPSWAASCQPSPGMDRPLRPEGRPRGRLGPKKAPGLQAWPGRQLRVEVGLGRPGAQEAAGSGWREWRGGRAGWGRGAAGAGGAPSRGPGRPAAHLLQAARGVRLRASGDQLLSQPPLYSDSIRGSAAYALCQSPASRSGGVRLGGGNGLAAAGTEEATCAAGIAGPGRRSAGRAGGRTDGLAETGGQAGGAGAREAGPGGGAAAWVAAAAGGAGGVERGRPLPGTPRPGPVGQPRAPGRLSSRPAGTPQLAQGGRSVSDHPTRP